MKKGYRNTIKHTISIGIVGSDSGVGVTHLSIMLANYLASKKQRSVAAADFSESRSYEVLHRLYEDMMPEEIDNPSFRIHQVDYYSGIVPIDIAMLLQMGYEYVIMDLGRMCSRSLEEAKRCHIRILLGGCCEWRKNHLMDAIERWILPEREFVWQIAAFLGIDTVKEQIEHQFAVQIQRIPYEEDPFVLHRNHFAPLSKLLQEEVHCL